MCVSVGTVEDGLCLWLYLCVGGYCKGRSVSVSVSVCVSVGTVEDGLCLCLCVGGYCRGRSVSVSVCGWVL